MKQNTFYHRAYILGGETGSDQTHTHIYIYKCIYYMYVQTYIPKHISIQRREVLGSARKENNAGYRR